MLNILGKIIGSSNDRKLKNYQARLGRINDFESKFETLSDSALLAKTHDFRQRLTNGATLDSILDEAFATVREAAKRTLGQRHYDVQIIGGMVLNDGSIAEMRTGEGKTLVATAPVYLNALSGKGVHVVTVNDYLAKRDAEWMGQIYRFLGLETSCVTHDIREAERRKAYAADVTYGTNNEFGFDYLRDNMKYSLEDMVQRGHHYAIVDEVDSILIDEARTPLIISGPTDDRSDFYKSVDALIPLLEEKDFELDEKLRTVVYTEDGMERMETLLQEKGLLEGALYDPTNVSIVHHINQALSAHKLYMRDRHYIMKNRQVMLIDEFTGRMTPGRRMSDGLHQALEAKENVDIQPENQTLASITFQNYFRLFSKLAGMTGTAQTEAAEFQSTYGLDVIEIPTNKPVARIDDDDVVYRTAKEKYKAIIEEVKDCRERGQPVLLGTASIEKSELISDLLTKAKIKHQVLNARHHEQEAQIIAQAGIPGAITVATNMAGRGTDIQLGGNLEMRLQSELTPILEKGETPDAELVKTKTNEIAEDIAQKKQQAMDAGGLYVLGTERHESRRIDNQLRGRTGRQGDPGQSKFYISIEDDLLRIFASERMDTMLQRLGLREDEAIVHPWMSKALETSQKKVEQRNFDARKNLLKYDDVINNQRKAVFEHRIDFINSEEVSETVRDMRHQVLEDYVSLHMPEKAYAEHWDIDALREKMVNTFMIDPPLKDWASEEGVANEEILNRLIEQVDRKYALKASETGSERMRWVEKRILLQTLDERWREHLSLLDHLRLVIRFRGYGQRDPLNEFKSEAFALFETLLSELRIDVTRILMHVRIAEQPQKTMQTHLNPDTGKNEMDLGKASEDMVSQDPSKWRKVPRNAPCPCGSGKKYKHCHGAVQ